jgi:glucose 1-dehydrogenase
MRGLANKNVLVTGASSGIGQAIALRFAEEGAHVAINYCRGEAGARKTQEQIKQVNSAVTSIIVQADVSQPDQVQSMFDTTFAELGGLDILINNAGYQVSSDSHKMPLADFANVIATNLTGAFMCAQLALGHFVEHKKPGVIINVSSVHEIIPKPTYAGYSASKGGLRNLTRTLALEYAERGIRVNGLGPGATVTPMNDAWVDDAEKRAIVENHIPMGRSGTSEEMAAVTAFLASDDASYITGQTLFVDGGLTLFPEFRSSWSS